MRILMLTVRLDTCPRGYGRPVCTVTRVENAHMSLIISVVARLRCSRLCQSILLAVIGLMVCVASPVRAEIRQLTSQADPACAVGNPTTDSAVGSVAFESTCDFTGENSDGNREIFQVDSEGVVRQITITSGCSSANPASDALGANIAFDSDCDIDGLNSDGNVEVFVSTPGGMLNLTNHTGLERCESLAPSIDAAGALVVFDSNCNFTGENFDANAEIYSADLVGTIDQLTDDRGLSGCGSFNASVNEAGDVVGFESDCDLVGDNVDEISEIFSIDLAAQPTPEITQLTRSEDDSCYSAAPSPAPDGTLFAFESNCDFAGANGDGSVEVFSVTSAGLITQLSDSSDTGCDSFEPSTNGDGDRVAFTSYCDLSGRNDDDGFEIFVATEAGPRQITEGASCWSYSPEISEDGIKTVYVSDCDPLGTNADGSSELFVSDQYVCGACGAPVSGRTAPANPTATDALLALQVAVGSGSCAPCECDVNNSGGINTTDSLLILRAAVGQGIGLDCPEG
jgi:Tol biopolymer transport system component